MSLDSQSKCPVNKLKNIVLPLLSLINGVRGKTNHSLSATDSPYTFQFWKKCLWLESIRSDVNKITSEFDIDELYSRVSDDWLKALIEYWNEHTILLKNWCESGLSIWIAKELIQQWKDINIEFPENLKGEPVEKVLQYLYNTLNSSFYDIAIDYIQSLKAEWEWWEISQEAKFLYLCMAFAELIWEKWLAKDTMEVIFDSGISNTIMNVIESVHLKIDTSGYDESVLSWLIDKNSDYWNNTAKSNIPVEYIVRWIWYEGIGANNTRFKKKKEGSDSREMWDFEENTIKIKYLFTEKDFSNFVRKFRRKISKMWPEQYVWCPLLYEKEMNSNSNMIIAFHNTILERVLFWLNQFYKERGEN